MARVGHASVAVGIAPEEVVKFAPGKIRAEANAGSGEHRRVFYRDFSYEPSTVNVPGVDTLLMVVYRLNSLNAGRPASSWSEISSGMTNDAFGIRPLLRRV
jgi:AraC family transcriptional regulator